MSKLVVGLTGGIGSGKTAVSDCFAQKGIDIIDADVIARQLVAPGQPALKAIIDRFGAEILLADGSLDRRRLRELVFQQAQHKAWLDELLHPLVREQMQQQSQAAASPYCMLSVPLLVENNLMHRVDRVLVVDVPEAIQLQRASARDQQSPEQLKRIMQNQASRSQRLAAADDVIDNSGDFQALELQVNKLHQNYLQRAKNCEQA